MSINKLLWTDTELQLIFYICFRSLFDMINVRRFIYNSCITYRYIDINYKNKISKKLDQ